MLRRLPWRTVSTVLCPDLARTPRSQPVMKEKRVRKQITKFHRTLTLNRQTYIGVRSEHCQQTSVHQMQSTFRDALQKLGIRRTNIVWLEDASIENGVYWESVQDRRNNSTARNVACWRAKFKTPLSLLIIRRKKTKTNPFCTSQRRTIRSLSIKHK